MNGQLTKEQTKADAFTATSRILNLSPNDEAIVENCFLACLTRRPTKEELEHFVAQLKDAGKRKRETIAEDLYWSLYNSEEFSWNH